MKRPAIFFDRDNTLIATDGYLGDPSKVALVDGAPDAIARARKLGFAIVVFSNQSGVARGMFSEDDVRAVNTKIDAMLRDANRDAIIDRHEFCPFHPEGTVETYRRDSDLRKPGWGMIRAAADALGIDVSKSWVIGDAARDIEAGRAAGCRAILFREPSLPESPAAKTEPNATPDATVASLKEAIDFVERSFRTGGSAAQSSDSLARLTTVAEDILRQIRRYAEHDPADFSVTKLLSGIVQVLSLAVMFLAYLNRHDTSFIPTLIVGVWLQVLTVALLLMGRSK